MQARWLSLFFLFIVVPVNGSAAKPLSAIERLSRLPTPDNDCKALEAELKAAVAPGLGRNGPIIREAKVDWITRRLESLNLPDSDLASIVSAAFNDKPEAALRELNRLGDGECILPVHRMIRILINTAVEPGQTGGSQKKILRAIHKWYSGGRTPTMARALVDFEIVQSGLKAGLWQVSTEKAKSLDREHSALMSLSQEFNKTYFGKVIPEKPSFKGADFKKLQPTFVREVTEANTLEDWIRQFVAELP